MKLMEMIDIYRQLADSINEGTCIAVIGAGVSATYEFKGKKYIGLPLARDILADLKKKRKYLADVHDLGEAAFIFREYEGRNKLEKYLCNILNVEGMMPLPAHIHLASLKLPCYVSMNFDSLLEKALDNAAQKPLVICTDEDVSLLTPRDTPVIKPHGTVERPSTMCIAIDETLDFNERIPIVANFLSSWLSNRTVLFIGFGLSDRDFFSLIRHLKRNLGDYMPHSIAVIRNKKKYIRKFWEDHNIQIVEADATQFLFELNQQVKRLRFQLGEDLEPWMRNEFFWELLKIRGLPTETQVIDSLLNEIKRRINEGYELEDLHQAVNDAVSLVLDFRSNYAALYNMGKELDNIFRCCKEKGHRLWDEFCKLEKKRIAIQERINAKATSEIGGAKSILIYSQSKRVVDFLLALDPLLQKDIYLYIGECRPKSPQQFQDAISTSQLLRGSKYKIRFIPDVAIFHLLLKKQIELVLMGAHEVFESKDGDQYEYFINTCGSDPITIIAETMGIPVKVIFERAKVVALTDDSLLESVSFDEEEYISSEADQKIAMDRELAERVFVKNIGYDLVKWRPNVTAVTDDV